MLPNFLKVSNMNLQPFSPATNSGRCEDLASESREDEAQFTTKIGGKTSLGPSYVALSNFHSNFDGLLC
jgi:hypothetical protein